MQLSKGSILFKARKYIIVFTIFFMLLNSFLILSPINLATTFERSESLQTGSSRANDFELEFFYEELSIEPSSDDRIDLKLTNKASSEDTFSLTFQEIPSGWSAEFLDDSSGTVTDKLSITLKANNNKNIFIYIKAPKSGKGDLTVACTSSSQIKKTARISLEAKYIITISLNDKNNQHSVEAGKNTTFSLDVKNHQSVSDILTLSLDYKKVRLQNYPDVVDWAAAFNNDSFLLEADETQTVILSVFAPTTGKPGDRVNLYILIDSDESTQEFKSPELIAKIPIIYNITPTIKLETQEDLLLPNTTVNYSLILENYGNVDTSIKLMLHENLGNWNVLFFLDKNLTDIENIMVKVKALLQFQVQLKIPINAIADTHKIVYGIYVKDKESTPINEIMIETKVQLTSALELKVPGEGGVPPELALGKTSTFEIEVHNKGNGRDVLTISIYNLSIPTDWDVYFSGVKNTDSHINTTKNVDFDKPIAIDYVEPMEYLPLAGSALNYNSISVELDADKRAYVSLTIKTPTIGKPNPEFIKIYGESISSTIATTIKVMTLNVRVSDLIITELVLKPEEPIRGEKVTVEFNVTNRFHLPANNIYVTLYKLIQTEQGPQIVSSKEITTLEAGSSETIKFTWIEPEDSPTGYILEAELSGESTKHYNTTPSRSTYVTTKDNPVEKKTDGDGLSVIIPILVIAVILAIIFFVILRIVISRSSPPQDKIEIEPRKRAPLKGSAKYQEFTPKKHLESRSGPRMTKGQGNGSGKKRRRSGNGSNKPKPRK